MTKNQNNDEVKENIDDENKEKNKSKDSNKQELNNDEKEKTEESEEGEEGEENEDEENNEIEDSNDNIKNNQDNEVNKSNNIKIETNDKDIKVDNAKLLFSNRNKKKEIILEKKYYKTEYNKQNGNNIKSIKYNKYFIYADIIPLIIADFISDQKNLYLVIDHSDDLRADLTSIFDVERLYKLGENNFEEILLERKCEQNVDRFLLLIRAKIVELLLNPRLYQEKNGPCLEALLYVFNNLLTFLKEGKIKFLNKILKTKNLEMLFSFIWLLDEPKKSDLFDILKNKYISLLILFLQISSSQIFDQYKIQSTKTFSHFINLTDKPKKHQKESYSEYARNISEDNNENSIIQMFLEKSLEFRKNTNIFSNLALIIVKSNTINLLKEAKIIQVQKCFMEEIKDNNKNRIM